MKKAFFLLFVLCCAATTWGQVLSNKKNYTRQDTLRGSITPERAWWELTYYDLAVKVVPDEKFISGSNEIHYRVLAPNKTLQVDLQQPLQILKVTQDDQELKFRTEGNAHFITLQKEQVIGDVNKVKVFYNGNPRVAKRAPWDGGFSWKKDDNGNHFIATSNQGLGASVWWPNKDHMYQEVDSMAIRVNVPSDLMNISNGRLRKVEPLEDNTTTYHWFVNNPINNYGVNINIGKYVNFSEVYPGEKGDLDMDYYVLDYNLEKAQEHFKDAPKMMKAFEHWFGPYPFYEDSFKLVEVPYLGMEHQSSVTYGNKYQKGYLGSDLSGTGWGLKFDYIIIHEAGHEWFANNITNVDIADMWIHESFTTYSENLFIDYYYGKDASADYVIGMRRSIRNNKPIIGDYNVNSEGSGDMYYKGANIIHTLRQLVGNDEKWRMILRGLNTEFYHQTVTTQQVENYLSKEIGMNLEPFFDQYLRGIKVPLLEYKVEQSVLSYRWNNVVEGFNMPVEISINGASQSITPTTTFQQLEIPQQNIDFVVDRDYYVNSARLN